MSAELAELPRPINGDFAGADIISTAQFDRDDVDRIMGEANGMASMVHEQGRCDLLSDRLVANLFYEPSTRTFLSFEAAAKRLGAETLATQGVEYSSISKGETLEDTIRTVERYADVIAMRHSRIGAAAIAANASRVPIINGGDGAGEHPTQALLDLYTIQHKMGTVENLNVTMVGDLKNGRTVHSLARLLALYGTRLNYVSPKQLVMPEGITNHLKGIGVEQYATQDLMEVIGDTDVLYVTRTQKERFRPEHGIFKTIRGRRLYEKVKDDNIIDTEVMRHAKPKNMIVMHPFPRLNEIHTSVDSDPRAAYFDQIESGEYIRMALLALVQGRSIFHSSEEPRSERIMAPWMKTTGSKS